MEWAAQREDSARGQAVRFTYTSRDGEEGFPGTVHVTVTYSLTEENELITEMSATTGGHMLARQPWLPAGAGWPEDLEHLPPGRPVSAPVRPRQTSPFSVSLPPSLHPSLPSSPYTFVVMY